MYAQRLGVARSLASNPIGALHGVGVTLAFGSDSPVTPLDPWGTVRAAMPHHNPAQRMAVRAAFAAHTRGGWRAVRRDDEGVLAPGAPATFAVWDDPGGDASGGLPMLTAADPDRGAAGPTPLPVCRRTVLRGDGRSSTGAEEEFVMTRPKAGPGSGGGPQARHLARRAGQPVVDLARTHTTVSVERAVLRLAGVTGADPDGIPWVNRLVDAVARRRRAGPRRGAAGLRRAGRARASTT